MIILGISIVLKGTQGVATAIDGALGITKSLAAR